MERVKIFTGVRPTRDLTVANYIGAIKPFLELQKKKISPIVLFVADLHAMTDQDPRLARAYTFSILIDYLALGIDPKKVKIYLQSDIGKELSFLTLLLSREISVAELLRVPTLKEKIKASQKPEQANTMLFLYPLLMAADILAMRAEKVPVGEDQIPHLEICREIARKFNKKYGNVFVLPKPLLRKPVRILSLVGEGKMSKSKPEGAIFLTDSKEKLREKIRAAQTAFEGQMTPHLESLLLMGIECAKDEKEKKELKELIERHLKGEKVMANFKEKIFSILANFLKEFQQKRKKISKEKDLLQKILKEGKEFAKKISNYTLSKVKKVLKIE